MTAATPADMDFLKTLDQRLHLVEKKEFPCNPVRCDTYTERRMTPEELRQVLRTVRERNNLVIYPITARTGLSVGFSVDEFVTPAPGAQEARPVLRFLETQLPNGYTFDKLRPSCASDNNRRKLECAGLESTIHDRGHYDG